MPIFLPVGFKLMSAEILFAPLTTDVTLILQFIPQPKGGRGILVDTAHSLSFLTAKHL